MAKSRTLAQKGPHGGHQKELNPPPKKNGASKNTGKPKMGTAVGELGEGESGCGRKRKLPALNLAPGRAAAEPRNPDTAPCLPEQNHAARSRACRRRQSVRHLRNAAASAVASATSVLCQGNRSLQAAQATTLEATNIIFLRIEPPKQKARHKVPSLQPPK